MTRRTPAGAVATRRWGRGGALGLGLLLAGCAVGPDFVKPEPEMPAEYRSAMTPVEDRYSRSAFVNQTFKTTRAHYARAVMEGVSYNLRWLLPYVEKFIGRRFESLNYIGGGAQSGTWCQIMADVLNRPIRQIADPRQANVRGAGLIGAMALGLITLDDVASVVPVMNTYEPRAENRKLYDAMAREFVEFYKRNKGMYKRLNANLYGA